MSPDCLSIAVLLAVEPRSKATEVGNDLRAIFLSQTFLEKDAKTALKFVASTKQGRNLLPVQQREVTHQLRKFLA